MKKNPYLDTFFAPQKPLIIITHMFYDRIIHSESSKNLVLKNFC